MLVKNEAVFDFLLWREPRHKKKIKNLLGFLKY